MNRAELEKKIKNFAEAAGIIFIEPAVETKKGKIEMVNENGYCMEDICGDWVVNTTIEKLDNEDFEKVYSGVMNEARKILSMSNR